MGLGCLQELVEAGRGPRWSAGGQVQMAKNLDNHCGIFNGGNERHGATALRTGGQIDFKHPFEQLRPTQASPRCGRGELAVPIGGVRQLVGLAWDDLGSEGGMGREHAMEANEMEPRPWDECGQSLQEFRGAHHEMGGAIAVRRFELQGDLTGPGAAQSFVAKGRARNVATEAFEGVPLMGAAAGVGMQAKPLGTDTALWLQRLLTGKAQGGIFPRQHFLPRSGPEGNAVGTGRRVQGRQGGIAIGVSQVGGSWFFFDECALASQHLQQPRDDPRE